MAYRTVFSVGKGYEVVNARSLWSLSELFVPYFIDEIRFGQSMVLLIFRFLTFPMHVTCSAHLILLSSITIIVVDKKENYKSPHRSIFLLSCCLGPDTFLTFCKN